MKINGEDAIKEQAGSDMVILLSGWKKRALRLKIYKCALKTTLVVSCLSLLGLFYYNIDSSIPSVIHIRAGEEQSFHLGVPAKGEIVSVSESGESNIPAGAVDIDLSRTVTLKSAQDSAYEMRVKLFGILPFKQVGIQVIEDQELIPVGRPIGIYVKTDGVLVVGTGDFKREDGTECSPCKYILKSGDYIRKVNGQVVTEKDDFIDMVEKSGGREIVLTLERDGELLELSVKPEKDSAGKYKIGAWVRDNAQGVGTMTYIDSRGNFGALGHGIADVDTSMLMLMEDGTLYETDIVDIKKGTTGTPGEMTGMIIYSNDHILGDITSNSSKGIFGVCNEKALAMGTREPLPIGLKQEIQLGTAQILCTVDGSAKFYDVEITALHMDHDNVNRGIELKVTDPALLKLTGGIVQGMFTGYNWCKDTEESSIY